MNNVKKRDNKGENYEKTKKRKELEEKDTN